MQTRSGNVYRYNLARPTLEKKVEVKVEKRVEPKVEVKVEPRLNSSSGFARRPSGFVTPTISDELAQFLKVPAGTILPRSEVSKLINGYIRANNLQDANNGRVIKPDAKLRKLLNVKSTDEVTYFNLQRHMKHHFTRDY